MNPNKSKTVLVVEDEENIRSFVAESLKSHGFNVLEARQGKEGLEVLKISKPDIIVTDVKMPEMDGIEFYKEIRANPKTKNIPVIMLTVKDDFSDIKYAYVIGVQEYITKPFEPEILVKRINEVLSEASFR